MSHLALRAPRRTAGLRLLLAPTAALSLGLALFAGPAAAEEAQGRFFDPSMMDAHRQERLEKMEQRIREDIAPALELDQGQTDALVALAREQFHERHAAKVLLRAEREALKVFLREDRSEAEIAAQLDRLLRAQEAMPTRGALIEESARFLTVEQQARLALMLPELKGDHHGKGKKPQRMRGEPAPGTR